ncbi:MAG: AsmA-like C-terminal domain-containing protein [Syntrophobacterales bacterium]|jgi:uncharacterized protein YhdP
MKSTRWKKARIILAVLAVVVIAGVLIIPKLIDPNRYKGQITSELEEAMGGKVTLGHLYWGIKNGVWLEADGFTVKGATVFSGDVDLSRIYAEVSVIPLLSRRVIIKELLVEGTELTISSKPTSKPPAKKGDKSETEAGPDKKASKPELPPFLRKLTVNLHATMKRGELLGQKFQDLTLKANYDQGVLKKQELKVLVAGGRIETKSSADFGNLQRIPFSIESDISVIPLESIASILDLKNVSARGPLTMTGRVQGRTGSTADLLGSLRGSIEAEVGGGRIYDLGPAGNTLFKILSVINLKGFLSGKIADNLVNKGIPFDSITYRASFKDGIMSIEKLGLTSPGLNMDVQGTVDLVNRNLSMTGEAQTLGTLDKVLGLVPVAGKAAQKLTKLYLDIKGPWEDPKISVRPAKGLTEAIK